MFKNIELSRLDDYFTELKNRSVKGIYFYRINSYAPEIQEFIQKYYDIALKNGVVIEGRIPNPDIKNLEYYNEILGKSFQNEKMFIFQSLRKWLPRLNVTQIDTLSSSMYEVLTELQKQGKNENMLKNTYIKFMCWLYYKFERIISKIGEDTVPKILYEGEISQYELLLIKILAGAGCDVVLLQYNGDGEYLKLDPQSRYSFVYRVKNPSPFPADFSVKNLREKIKRQEELQRLYGPKPSVLNCTNAWISGRGFSDLKVPIMERGKDPKLFYNCYCRMNGVEHKPSYLNELYQFQMGVKNSKRKLVIIENKIPIPTVDEIGKVKKGNYDTLERLITDLSSNIKYPLSPELQRLAVRAFIDTVLALSKESDMTLNRLTNRCVYLLCWLKRYGDILFENWKMPEVSCLIYLGGCQNENEALFIKMLAKLPTDILILVPDRNQKCCLEDDLLYEMTYDDSLAVDKFPADTASMRVGTVAYHAERELDTLMYQDSGMYRNQQYGTANSLVLQTMYEEIAILWDQELKFRPNFSTENNMVVIPTIFAKVCGVKDGNIEDYWLSIKKLLVTDTLFIDRLPCIKQGVPNPWKNVSSLLIRNGKLRRDEIKKHKLYKYGVLREEAQEHILNKLQLLLDKRFIKGTFENGTENVIIATVLNMDKTMVRLIQKFDFTKTNPKVVCLSLNESEMSLEDTIIFTFLNLIGFDIVFFVPTGYQTIERYMNKEAALIEEHQIGEYMYDLTVPNFNKLKDKAPQKTSWFAKLFGK